MHINPSAAIRRLHLTPSACMLAVAAWLLLGPILWSFTPAPARAARSGGTNAHNLVVAIKNDVDTLDPALAQDTTSFLVTQQVYDTLVEYQPSDTIPVPGLAISWTVSTDGLIWTFELRPGLKFQDGTDLDAPAVAYNLNRWWDPANPQHIGDFPYFGALFGGFKGDSNCLISAINTIGASKIQITLSTPNSSLPSLLAFPAFGIASQASIQAGTLANAPVGSGPFKFSERVSSDHIRLVANSTYWDRPPQLQSLTFLVIANDANRYAALKNGSAQSAVDLPDSYTVSAASNPYLRVLWRPSLNVGYMGMNLSRPFLSNLQVRQAIAHAVNLQNLINNYYTPGDQLASQFLPPVIWGYNPAITSYSYDPTLALSLLTAAGYSNGFSTTLSYRLSVRDYLPNPAAVANAIKLDLQAVGIAVTLIELDPGIMIDKWHNGDLDLYLLGWSADYPHAQNFITPNLCDANILGFGPLDNQLCDKMQSALQEPSIDEQLADYQWASQRINDNLPLLPIANARSALITRLSVVDLQASPIGVEVYGNVDFAEKMFLPLLAR